jgi:hypothetical protein
MSDKALADAIARLLAFLDSTVNYPNLASASADKTSEAKAAAEAAYTANFVAKFKAQKQAVELDRAQRGLLDYAARYGIPPSIVPQLSPWVVQGAAPLTKAELERVYELMLTPILSTPKFARPGSAAPSLPIWPHRPRYFCNDAACPACSSAATAFVPFPDPPAPSPLEEIKSDEWIVGWRAWRVERSTGHLKPLYSRGTRINGEPETHLTWAAGELSAARCASGKLAAECKCGQCGWHAFKDRDQALEEYIRTPKMVPRVVGTVALGGTIIEHENGYRAEFAYPKKVMALTCDCRDPECTSEHERLILGRIAALYGCETELVKEWD